MTKNLRKVTTWLLGALACIAMLLGIVVSNSQVKMASAADTAVSFSAAFVEGHDNEKDGYLQLRMDTNGQTWTKAQNNKTLSELPSTITDYTTINGRTLTELQNACTSKLPLIVTLQPAGSFSFIRVWVPSEFMNKDAVKSIGVLDGWAFNDGVATYTSGKTTFLNNGAMVLESNYNSLSKLDANTITISDAKLVHRMYPDPDFASRSADSYMVDINIGKTIGEYDAMYDAYKKVRSAIYINGKSIDEWNTQMIAEDARFNEPSSYTYFPQSSTDPSHKDRFVKPVGLWGTSTGFRLSIYQELVAELETVVVTVGSGCQKDGEYIVSERISKTVLTQNVVDLTNKLTFLDNSVHNPAAWGPTKLYFIHTNNETAWTKAPIGGCLNEADPSAAGGGQIQMKYVTFNGSTLYDINKNDNGSYGSTQDNIKNGGVYAPILVTMSTELGASLKLTVPTNFTNGKAGHEEIVIKKGFNIKEGNTSYVVTSDIIFTNNGTTAWKKEVKAIEIATSVTGIITKANRTDGGNNENFVIFQLSNNDYEGLNTTAIADISTLYGYIDIDGTVLNSKPNEPFFNVWGIQNSVAFRAPGLDANGLQQVKYITIKAGAKFPAYTTQNGGKATCFVTTEDVTFVHDVPNDTWTVGEVPAATHTVTFMVDGAEYTTQTVENGGVATMPTAPTKEADDDYTYTFTGWTLNGAAYNFATPVKGDITLTAQFTATKIERPISLIETQINSATYHISTENNDDRWLYFTLTDNDYSNDVSTYDVTVATIKAMGLFEKITIRGDISLGGRAVTEATLEEIGVANGYGEAVFINVWGIENTRGSLAFRVKGANSITEVVIEEDARFPSYAYISGATKTETYYTVLRTTTLINNNKDGLTGSLVADKQGLVDIRMANGAAVRVTTKDETSGLRFEVKVAKEDINWLYGELDARYTKVVFGILIVPTDYLVGGKFTTEWLEDNGFDYIELTYNIKELYGNFPKEDGQYYSYFGTVGKLKKENYNRQYSAVGYVSLYKESGEERIYAEYDERNSRSAAFVANAAINDRSATKTDVYAQYISANNNYSRYGEDDIQIIGKYIVGTEESAINAQDLTALATKGGSQTITPTNQKLAGPYVELVYSTNVNVWGKFTYTDGNKTATEDFYLQANTTSHKQYLDIFRYNGVGYGMNVNNISMTSIAFTNAELATSNAPTGKVKVYGLYSQNKTIDTSNQEIYLTVAQADGSEVTVGAHLGLGGALTYLAKSGIYEGVVGQSENNGFTQSLMGYTKYKYNTGSLVLSTDTSVFDENRATGNKSTEAGYYGHATSSKAADGAVNLINNFDAGRQIQQSWYAEVGHYTLGTDENGNTIRVYDNQEGNGYTRAFCKTESKAGKYWPYNPVQAGDVVSNPGQIVNYEINTEKGYIYIKARAMDWAKGKGSDNLAGTVEGGVTTKSYMENYYILKSDGTLQVDNTFVDWNGFTDMETCDWASTELPAVYPVQTLNTYVSNVDGDGSWTDAIEYNSDMKPWTGGTAFHQFSEPKNGATKVEDWFAWANGTDGNAFAMGVYIPNVSRYTSGRSITTTGLSEAGNRNAVSDNILKKKGLMSNMQAVNYTYQSAYVGNTSYTAPGVDFRMEAYKSIEYSYVICLGTVDNIRSTFKEIKDNGEVTNTGNGYQKAGLDAWARADKIWTW